MKSIVHLTPMALINSWLGPNSDVGIALRTVKPASLPASRPYRRRGILPASALAAAFALALASALPSIAGAQQNAGPIPRPRKEGPLTPAEALRCFKVPNDLQITPVLSEPRVRQPVFLNFDERGRMWVVQYLQYPHPAGLKILSNDKYYRIVYDKVPPPPPHQFRGQDKITIFEDTDGNGTYDKEKTFLGGLNIVTAVTRGRGGIWVLNPPYLLFYPDRNNDDVPDGDPVVCLSGFGLEDTHSVVNNLRWGPDGWLYGCQGSTVSGNVTVPGSDAPPVHSMGQLIWRYQPESHRYEIFAEGGGNCFGLEIDSKGRVYSGHNGGDTRGFYYVQGGYYQKGFSKHGPLSNPYAFGYFPPMPSNETPRFTHTFLIYEGGALPAHYQGKLFGAAPLLHYIVCSRVIPEGSAFRTRDISFPVTTSDPWFRPVAIRLGPDGAIYIADWYDRQINHYRNHEGQIDKSNGRIYRLSARGAPPAPRFDLGRLSTEDLIQQLHNKNRWFRQTALRLIGDRHDTSVIPLLKKDIATHSGQFALECLWALHLSGGLTPTEALKTLDHPNPYVRLWTARLLGDDKLVAPPVAARLAELAQRETNAEVRAQLACSARRLPARQDLPIVRNLLTHSEDVHDPYIPLLLWWAIEAKTESNRDAVIALFNDSQIWRLPLVQKAILGRLMRRYAMPGTIKDYLTCAKLLRMSPERADTKLLLAGFQKAFEGRPLSGLPDALLATLAREQGESVVLGLRQRRPEALKAALKLIGNPQADHEKRLEYIRVLGEVPQPQAVPALLHVPQTKPDPALGQAAFTALQSYGDPSIADRVLSFYPHLSPALQRAAQALLVSRPEWTQALLKAIEHGFVHPRSIAPEMVRAIRLYSDPSIQTAARRIWPQLAHPTTGQMEQEIQRLHAVLDSGQGSPYSGKKLFMATCGVCHRLFGQGAQIGPDLTSYKRDDLDTLLLNIVNPNASIREGFETYNVKTSDGRTLTGFLFDQNQQVIVLRGLDGQKVALPRAQVLNMKATGMSLMPEGLLQAFNDQQVRDLFAYLRSSQPLNN